MADFDNQSKLLPVPGHAVAPMDGTHKTGVIDTIKGFSLTFIAVLANAVGYGAVSWAMECSSDGVTWFPVAADDILVRAPKPAKAANGDPIIPTSTVFHCGYVGKRRMVRAACTAVGGGDGVIVGLLGHLRDEPCFYEADIPAYPIPGSVIY
jgi:hypothetical protein